VAGTVVANRRGNGAFLSHRGKESRIVDEWTTDGGWNR